MRKLQVEKIGRLEMSYMNPHEKACKSTEIFMTTPTRKCHKDVARDASFTILRRKKGKRRHRADEDDERGRAFASAYNRLGFSRLEYRLIKTSGSARALSIHPATRLRQSWILCDRLSRELEASEKRVGDGWARLREEVRGWTEYSIMEKRKRKDRRCAASWRFWGVEVERPVKNVIKMCLELPRGKDVMNIKRILERRVMPLSISIYAQVGKQPRICCREIDFLQKQEGFIQARRCPPFPSPFLIFSLI